ncbi:hypothetical protein [Anoxynatronum buryatiense]|uniref:Uncharacterized protein n=1 Tax=Anoxynatronum buryatiense TaxID=489973 RepID=A0AA45WWV7_9CLOT|nr:hypothetical protein [Anoxynatronum buryatiense]SMP60704.1 hypothetical protein SAMN06296020_108168 [Anoxynatronum buryatiense]
MNTERYTFLMKHHRYVIVLALLMLFSTMVTLSNELSVERLSHMGEASLPGIKTQVESNLRNQAHHFENDPKKTVAPREGPVKSGQVMLSVQDDVMSTYSMLSLHQSWLMNRILLILMNRGQVYMAFIGMIIATGPYGNGMKADDRQNANAKQIVYKQLRALTISTISLLVVGLLLGLIVGSVRYATALNHTEILQYVNGLYQEYSLWKPGITASITAGVGAFLYLLVYGIVGLFIGHIIKERIMALLIMFFTMNYWFVNALYIPVTPIYYLHRVIHRFIFNAGMNIITIPGFQAWDFLMLPLLCLLLLGISYKSARYSLEKPLK